MPDRVHAATVQTDDRETVMIVDYNRSPNITEEERLASLQDSVQRALDELMQMISGIETPEKNGLVEKVEVVTQKAGSAKQRAVFSQQLAEEAQTMADEAGKAAQTAWNYADEAKTSAEEAKGSARIANTAANAALTQVSIIEDVAGTLQWIQEHGSYVATADTVVDPTKIYFIYNSTAQDYEPIVSPDPEKNPAAEGWFELDVSDSQAEFIMAHIAVTARGLWVLPSGINTGTVTPDSSIDGTGSDAMANARARLGSDYKVLLSNDGMHVYDGLGIEVSVFGENIVFNSLRRQVIGGQNNYILFDPTDGSISINGSNVKIGDTGKKLDEVLTDIDISTEQTATGAEITIAGQTVELLNGQDGQQGAPGYTPYIQGGYWYINGTSTGVKAEGIDGTTTVWYYGDKITGTSTTPTIFSGSGITNAVIGDMYLNTETSNVYQCTLGGNAATAKWVYSGSIAEGVLDNIEVGGRNLYCIVNAEDGYLDSDGTVSEGTGRNEHTSALIPVVEGEQYVFQNWVTPDEGSTEALWMAYVFYDENEDYISNTYESKTAGAGTAEPQHETYQITVPSGAAYIRVSARMYDDGLIKFEKGNVGTDWTAATEDSLDMLVESVNELETTTRERMDGIDGVIESNKDILDEYMATETAARQEEDAKKVNIGNSQITSLDNHMQFNSANGLEVFETEDGWKVRITSTGIELSLDSVVVAAMQQYAQTNESIMKADNALMGTLRMRSSDPNATAPCRLGIEAQSNGHLSMKEF